MAESDIHEMAILSCITLQLCISTELSLHHLLLCLRMPFETTATLFLLALSAGKLAASLSRALLCLSGSMTTPGVFRILGRVRFLRQVEKYLRYHVRPELHLTLGTQEHEHMR